MIDPILNSIYRFLDERYVERELLFEFNDKRWEFYGIARNPSDPLVKHYPYSINDTNPYTGDTNTIKYDYHFNDYIREKLIQTFEDFEFEYNISLRCFKDEVKKSTFFSRICKELDDFKKLSKSKRHLSGYHDTISSSLKEFKQDFSTISVQKATYHRNIPNTFQIKSDSDTDIAIYRLSAMFYELRNKGFIHEDTTKELFESIFLNKPLSVRVEWIGGLSSFYYFIKKLNNSRFIENGGQNKWSIADKCFVLYDKWANIIDRKKFRLQKNPKELSMKILDQILNS